MFCERNRFQRGGRLIESAGTVKHAYSLGRAFLTAESVENETSDAPNTLNYLDALSIETPANFALSTIERPTALPALREIRVQIPPTTCTSVLIPDVAKYYGTLESLRRRSGELDQRSGNRTDACDTIVRRGCSMRASRGFLFMTEAGSFSEAGSVISQTDTLAQLGPVGIRGGYGERGVLSACASVAVGQPTVPWWLWWNVLSLDAPMVAVAWLAVFAEADDARLMGVNFAILALAVWIIYVSDRLLDGWAARDRGVLQTRHFFCEKQKIVLAGMLAIAGATLLLLIFQRLPSHEVAAGIGLGAIVILYMASIHARQRSARQNQALPERVSWMWPKEITVGIVFACGTTLPLWSRNSPWHWSLLVPWVFFAMLCCLNTLAIECWESGSYGREMVDGRRQFVQGSDAKFNRWASGLAAAALIAAGARSFAWSSNELFTGELLAVALGASLILILNILRERFSSAALRVLADVALFVPPTILLVVRGWA
jgi:hypothetical protein